VVLSSTVLLQAAKALVEAALTERATERTSVCVGAQVSRQVDQLPETTTTYLQRQMQ